MSKDIGFETTCKHTRARTRRQRRQSDRETDVVTTIATLDCASRRTVSRDFIHGPRVAHVFFVLTTAPDQHPTKTYNHYRRRYTAVTCTVTDAAPVTQSTLEGAAHPPMCVQTNTPTTTKTESDIADGTPTGSGHRTGQHAVRCQGRHAPWQVRVCQLRAL